MAYAQNPYYNSRWADTGKEIAKLLGGDPEMAAKTRYTNATTALTEAKQQRQQIENDALMTGLEESLNGMGLTPADYNKNLPALYASMARAGVDPRVYQTGIFGARSMVNSPREYTGGAMVTNAKEPSWMNPSAHGGRSGGRGGRGGYAPIKITAKDRSAMEEMAASLLGDQFGEDFSLDAIPADALFRARQAGENTYQNSRSQMDAAAAMVEALGLPEDAQLGEVDSTPGSNWNPLNWGGGKPAILDSSGAEIDFNFMPSGAGAAPAMPAARAARPDPFVQQLEAEAQEAIAKGADPAAVNARMQKMLSEKRR